MRLRRMQGVWPSISSVDPQQDVGVVEEDGEQFIVVGEERIMAVSELKIFGQHNVENALAALALGWAADIPKNSMMQALIGFNGLPHRCQYVAYMSYHLLQLKVSF